MTRKPAFWITLALLGVAGSVVAIRLFPTAFPLLAVDVEMDRSQAVERARTLAEQFDWGPAEAREAASFGQVDPAFQTYMELEGGGLEELNRLIREGQLVPYVWRVRRFAQGAVEEVEVRFTPSGTPYGFNRRLPEDAPGTNVSSDEARAIAVEGATDNWGMAPSSYELLESSEEEQTGGRIDHTLVFQRTDLSLGEATLRLRLRVAGDELVEVTRFAHVPDAFLRRYQDTREANDSISLAGTIVFVLLFLLLGGGAGTAYLLREHLVEWRTPLIWGAVIAALMALDTINNLPLAWMGYDTALSTQVFLALTALMAVGIFLAGTAFLTFVFLAGEGLLRRGFPNQLQQWKLWSPGVANSSPALGRTAAPYLALGLELGYVVAFYTIMTRFAGWWSPASSLVEPNLLATPFPWLTALSNSLFAAFSEESLFRAIPIGAAAILGRRYGKAGLWIWGTIVLQALVFAASHANYPQQPSYARLVEIFPIYIGWGTVCLYFGLIPSIISHFLYDLTLFSLPLFAAHTSGIWISRAVVIAAGLFPLLLVLVARWRQGGVATVPEWALNRSWAGGRRRLGQLESPRVPPEARPPLPAWVKAGIVALGAAGFVLWFAKTPATSGPRFTITRAEAVQTAREALSDRGFEVGTDWTPLVSLDASQGAAYQFVWDTGTEEQYEEMLGRFLALPALQVRFVRFEVAPEERAETYTVRVGPSGRVVGLTHALPEGRAGATLTEDEARDLARQALENRLDTRPEAVREISAEETARPNRADWTFTFADTTSYPLDVGEGRLEVRIAGDEVVSARRFVHVPEEWQRQWRSRQTRELLATLPPGAILAILGFAMLIWAIIRWSRKTLWTQPLRPLAAVVAVIVLLTAVNDWPREVGTLTTLQSFGNQAAVVVLGLGLGLVMMAGGVGVLGSLAYTWIGRERRSDRWAWAVGVGLGAAAIGAGRLLRGLTVSGPPAWPDYGNLVSYWPWVSDALQPVLAIVATTTLALLLFSGLNQLRRGGQGWLAAPILLVIGLMLVPFGAESGWLPWLGLAILAAGALGVLWYLNGRLGWAVLPAVLAASILLGEIRTIRIRAYPGSVLGGLAASVLVVVALHLWTRSLVGGRTEPPESTI